MVRDTAREARVIADAIAESKLPPSWVAEQVGVTDSALRRYRGGSRAVPPELRLQLAAVFTAHQATLARLARQLLAGGRHG